MPKVLVLFHSHTGRTAAIAEAIARGAESVKFTEVELRRIDDLAPPDASDSSNAGDESASARDAKAKTYRTLESIESLLQYDALIIGSPARYGGMSAELEHMLDQAETLGQQGALADKVASAFGASDTPAAGLGAHVTSVLVALMHFGMIIVPPPGGDGAELAMAERHGARVAKVAEWVRHAKSHEAHGHHH